MNFGQPENHENEVPTQKGWVFRNQDFLYNFLRLKSQKRFSDPKTRSPWSLLMSGFWDGHFDNLFWKKMFTTWRLFQKSKVPWVRGERLLSYVYHRFQLIIGKKFFWTIMSILCPFKNRLIFKDDYFLTWNINFRDSVWI